MNWVCSFTKGEKRPCLPSRQNDNLLACVCVFKTSLFRMRAGRGNKIVFYFLKKTGLVRFHSILDFVYGRQPSHQCVHHVQSLENYFFFISVFFFLHLRAG